MGKTKDEKLLKKMALRIKQLREGNDIIQEVFYNDTGVNIGRIERAKRDFSMTTLNTICKYFKISITEFFKGIE